MRPTLYSGEKELKNLLKYADKHDLAFPAGRLLATKEELKIGGMKLAVSHVPGHTLGHIACWLRDYKTAFTGDLIFPLGCGSLFEGEGK